jgi:uncharacterized protein (DUF1800 family)
MEAVGSSLPIYTGSFGPAEAERLLWRAGFGPRPGEVDAFAALGLDGAVLSLTRPGRENLVGPEPTADNGQPLDPLGMAGHDQLWWFDRMVRTSRPLVERMTLIWHDWFATSNRGVGSRQLMLNQNELFRRQAFGSFETLLRRVTRNPAMLIWLNGNRNNRWYPNENYARELMELFTLGARRGYTERDVRQQARALTGWRNDLRTSVGFVNFRFDRSYHDAGSKRIFHRRGNFGWRDSVRLTVQHPKHPSFFVSKLWSYFVPTPLDSDTRRALQALYVSNRHRVRPVVEAILRHPALYEGPRMVKPPIVFMAGLLRAVNRGIDTGAWAWIGGLCGQQVFYPPSVAGWDDAHWLDTATFRGRWTAAVWALKPYILDPAVAHGTMPSDSNELLDLAIAFWGSPTISDQTRAALLGFSDSSLAAANTPAKASNYPVLVENALRQLVVVSPDFQTC